LDCDFVTSVTAAFVFAASLGSPFRRHLCWFISRCSTNGWSIWSPFTAIGTVLSTASYNMAARMQATLNKAMKQAWRHSYHVDHALCHGPNPLGYPVLAKHNYISIHVLVGHSRSGGHAAAQREDSNVNKEA
jgi:hypothetical protein